MIPFLCHCMTRHMVVVSKPSRTVMMQYANSLVSKDEKEAVNVSCLLSDA